MISMNQLTTNWNYDLLIKEENLEKDLEESKNKVLTFIKNWKDNKKYLENSNILKNALDEYEKISNHGITGANDYYYWLKQQLNLSDKEILAKLNKLDELNTQISNDLIFFTNQLAKIPLEKQKEFLKSNLLQKYKHFLESTFEHAKYRLSEKEEIIVNMLSKTASSNWTEMTERFLSEKEGKIKDRTGKEIKINWPTLLSYTYKTDNFLRNQAIDEIKRILSELNEIAEIELNSLLEYKRNMMKLRGFTYHEQSRHLSDEIDTDVVNAMIETVSNNFYISHEYYDFKAKLLKKDKFRYFDKAISVNISEDINTNEENKNEIWSYEKSIKLVGEVFKDLDKEFFDIFKYLSEDGHIDAYPKQGKIDGAFCIGVSPIYPTYILLNHTNELRDVTTIAHECGHAINNELMKQKQHSLYFGTPMCTAEVASTFMEDFVFQKLLEKTSKKKRLNLLLKKLDDEIATIFRQVACYKFESELHKNAQEKGYLSKNEISELFNKHMKLYLGKLFEEADDMDNGWVYWSHIRRPFYVYSYASGLIISKAMQAKVKEDHTFIEKVKIFLKNGEEKPPKEIFKEIGIDITKNDFWQKGIENFKKTLDEAKTLAKELNLITN